MWAGLITTLATAAQYAVPVGFVSCPGSGSSYKSYWRTDAGVGFNNANMNTLLLGQYTSTTESNSGKTPAVSVFLHGTGTVTQIPGTADDILFVPGGASFDDILTISANSYRVAGGGLLAFLI
jgi:hypothetical protein